MAKSFTAQIDEWIAKVEGRVEAVFRDSAQDVFSIAQTTVHQGGRLPFKVGNLRNSLSASLNGSEVGKGPDAYILAVDSAQLGDVIFAGWHAEYARRMEYGFVGEDSLGRYYNQKGFGFMAGAASQWQHIVDKNAARLREMLS